MWLLILILLLLIVILLFFLLIFIIFLLLLVFLLIFLIKILLAIFDVIFDFPIYLLSFTVVFCRLLIWSLSFLFWIHFNLKQLKFKMYTLSNCFRSGPQWKWKCKNYLYIIKSISKANKLNRIYATLLQI